MGVDGKKGAAPNQNQNQNQNQKTLIRNEDGDTDLAVGTTQTTGAVRPGERSDVIESRPEERRKVAEDRFALAPLIGYGSRDLNLGVGVRAGYTFRNTPVYVGGNFMDHNGESSAVATGGEAHTRFYYPSAEVGYDFGIGPMLLRPYVGAGVLFGSGSTSGGAPPASIPRSTDTAALVYPGATVHYLIPQTPGFVGADSRVLIPTEGNAAIAAFLTGGLNL